MSLKCRVQTPAAAGPLSRYGINTTISLFVSTAALHRSHSSTMASLQGKKDMRRADLSMCLARLQWLAHRHSPAPLYATMHPPHLTDHVH